MHLVRTLKSNLYLTFVAPIRKPKRAAPNETYWAIQDWKEARSYAKNKEPEIANNLQPGERLKVKLAIDDEPEDERLIIPSGEPPDPSKDYKLKQSNDDSDIPF